MKIYEFIDKYCQDILRDVRETGDLYGLDDLPNEGYKTTANGRKIPIVYIDGFQVPISDILTLDKEDFMKAYGSLPSALEVYNHYIEVVQLTEGEEVIAYIRNQVRANIQKIETESAAIIEEV